MNASQLLNHFDRICEAPDAIPRLRQFILGLAVRGKLVEQDPNDETVSELVERFPSNIKSNTVTDKLESHLPFLIPHNWLTIPLGKIAKVEMGQSPASEYYNQTGNGIPFYQGKADFGDLHPTPRYWCTQPKKRALYGDILISVRAPVGPTNVANQECCIGRGLAAIRPYEGVSQKFLLLCLKALKANLSELGFGTTFIAINKMQLVTFPIPLPPSTEQRRIVTKVEELMTISDQLEKSQNECENRRDSLTAASLHGLNNGNDDASIRKSASFFIQHLPHVITRREHINQLRKTILNLGVRGQLVPQDPNYELGEQLLHQIQREMMQWRKSTNIKKNATEVISKKLSFGFPPSWVSVSLKEILLELRTGPFGSSLHQSDYIKGGTPVINPASIQNGRILALEKMAVGPETLYRLSAYKLRQGDIVMARRGEMGRCAAVTEKEDGWLCGTGSLILRFPKVVFRAFMVMFLGSESTRKYLSNSAVGVTMQNLNQAVLLRLMINLPPFAEQQRIVARVDELMGMCNHLERQLHTREFELQQLLDALLHQRVTS